MGFVTVDPSSRPEVLFGVLTPAFLVAGLLCLNLGVAFLDSDLRSSCEGPDELELTTMAMHQWFHGASAAIALAGIATAISSPFLRFKSALGLSVLLLVLTLALTSGAFVAEQHLTETIGHTPRG